MSSTSIIAIKFSDSSALIILWERDKSITESTFHSLGGIKKYDLADVLFAELAMFCYITTYYCMVMYLSS